jgi:hemerythrin-like domain-containing protein
MNSATKNLENDHVYILRLIDVMEKVTNINRPDIPDLETIVNLIKNYADGSHHAKEENLLFPGTNSSNASGTYSGKKFCKGDG